MRSGKAALRDAGGGVRGAGAGGGYAFAGQEALQHAPAGVQVQMRTGKAARRDAGGRWRLRICRAGGPAARSSGDAGANAYRQGRAEGHRGQVGKGGWYCWNLWPPAAV